jgi:hypothetical protein
MILAGQLAGPADRLRFRQEAEAAAGLDHPNILPVFDVGEHDGHAYFSMKLVGGGNLAQHLAQSPRTTVRGLVPLLEQVARGVHHAHQRGILHRDLKPANILIDADGTPYVTDFGLAKKVAGDSGLTHTGAVVGTPSYMSPEQARGDRQVTTAADVYSLGAILYECLTGSPPFRAATVYETVRQVIEQEPVPPRALNPKADPDLAAVALKCLAKEPAGRYESATALADDLERWLAGEPTKARPLPVLGQAWRWLRRNATTAAGLAVLGTAAGLAGAFVPFAVGSMNTSLLLPEDASPLNPLGWMNAIRAVLAIRYTVLGLTAVLLIGGGWLVRFIARPKTPRAALGAATAVGLIAVLVAFAFLGPILASVPPGSLAAPLHPISGPDDIFPGRSPPAYPGTTVPRSDGEYLSRFLTDQERAGGERERAAAIDKLHLRAVGANRIYNGLAVGWPVLGFILVTGFVWALHGTGAADYAVRSGRGPLGSVGVYLELHLPILALTAWTLGVIGMTIILTGAKVVGPSWGARLIPVVGGGLLVGLAHVGVVRRWRWWVRLGLYLACVIAIVAGLAVTGV